MQMHAPSFARSAVRLAACAVIAFLPAVARAQRTRKANRPSWQEWIRGGKFWHHQMKSRPAVKLEPGQVYTVRASVDVIRDLESVRSFVKLTAQ